MNCLEVSITPSDTLAVSITQYSDGVLSVSVGLICDTGIGGDGAVLVDALGARLSTTDGYFLTVIKSE